MSDTDTPALWLIAQQQRLPSTGVALDVACGRGRNAVWLATRGLSVVALDRDTVALAALAETAWRLRLAIETRTVDLEGSGWNPGEEQFDAIVVTNYLHRPLVPQLVAALAPHGILIYETFTRAQARVGRPRNPDFLLESGELRRLVAPLTILDEREGEFEGRWIASIAARKPG